jgi:uncharacterized protein YdhG (YjbR/CyaY superfamily)
MDSTARNVDEYIEGYPANTQKRLKEIRALIKRSIPKAVEDISYLMPAYREEPGKRAFVFFAAAKDATCVYALHFGASPKLLKRAQPYITTKSTMRFPNDKPLPVDLLEALLLEKREELGL